MSFPDDDQMLINIPSSVLYHVEFCATRTKGNVVFYFSVPVLICLQF